VDNRPLAKIPRPLAKVKNITPDKEKGERQPFTGSSLFPTTAAKSPE
jgi:hypothetical protein